MKRATFVALAATIGNFLQGWDNATIVGAMVYINKEMNLPTSVQGLVVAMSLIGATVMTACSGPISDLLGRRPMLILSSVMYFFSGLIMWWSPNVYVLCLARLLEGFGAGPAFTIVPIYISETAPPEIRGQLNTLPQFLGSGGMFLSYCMVFTMSLSDNPSWRGMLGVLSIPSLVYLLFAVYYLPESPRWLVSKGRMYEAEIVLQQLRGREDVTDEMDLLFEGLDIRGVKTSKDLYVALEDSEADDSVEIVDEDEHMRLSRTYDYKWDITRPISQWDISIPVLNQWDIAWPGREQQSSLAVRSSHGSLANQSTNHLKDPLVTPSDSLYEPTIYGSHVNQWDTTWPAWPVQEQHSSLVIRSRHGSSLWSALLEPGVKRALVVGVGIQILQQFSGIKGVLYCTPQILERAGVDSLLSSFGLSSISASFLISGLTILLMLPAIVVAMRLMDLSGRRALLLWTIPVLIVSLILLVISELVHISKVVNAALSMACVILYLFCFMMGYGPIPNILCSEIFPTRVRGLCFAICAMVFWIGDIIVTYSLPVLLSSIGLVGVFSIYAAVCVISWIFVYSRVPEPKDMPLEVIIDYFASYNRT